MKRLIIIIALIANLPNWSMGQQYTKYYLQGKDLMENGRYTESIEPFTQAIIFKSNSSLLYEARGDAYYLSGKYSNALQDFTKAINLSPSEVELHYKRGISNLKAGNKEQAQNDFNTVTEMEYGSYYKAFALHYLGEKEAAIVEMREQINKQPGKWNYYKLSALYALQYRPKESLRALEKSIAAGFRDFNHMLNDPDLKNVRFTNGFKSLLNANGVDYQFDYHQKVQDYVEEKLKAWQQKGRYEKTGAYLARVNETAREIQIDKYKNDRLKAYRDNYLKGVDWNNAQIVGYDPDSETFKISLGDLGEFVLPVPIDEAEDFEKNFAMTSINDANVLLRRDDIVLSYLEIFFPLANKFYSYNIQNQADYDPAEFEINFDDVRLELQTADSPEYSKRKKGKKVVSIGKSDVDVNIPVNKEVKAQTFALIIGNEDYSTYQSGLDSEVDVEFAANDANAFKDYAIKTLGIPEKNIIFQVDATLGQMNQAVGKLAKLAKVSEGNAELIFYYAGHGLPHEKTKEPYLMPVDISGSNVENAIKLTSIYNQLTACPVKRVTVFLDACFSGGARNQGLVAVRGVKIKPKNTYISGNFVVFSSSTGEESSAPYKEKKHGIFTYFLLKKIQETRGDITYSDLADYVSKNVKLESVLVNSREQSPQVIASPTVGEKWKTWKLR